MAERFCKYKCWAFVFSEKGFDYTELMINSLICFIIVPSVSKMYKFTLFYIRGYIFDIDSQWTKACVKCSKYHLPDFRLASSLLIYFLVVKHNSVLIVELK